MVMGFSTRDNRTETPDADRIRSWGVRRISEAVRGREISAADVVKASLRRIAKANPTYNAMVDVYEDEALANADAVDAAVAAGIDPGPLAGVPTAIKDNTFTKGHPATDGVRQLADVIWQTDDPIVERVRTTGGNIIGRTNVPAHCWQLFCTNQLFGTTTNPRSPQLTPGGSSGGSAAAVASGMVPLAQGNDIGGSIRYPAYACGVVGLRTSLGAIPGSDPRPSIVKPFPFQIFATQGPLARTVDDIDAAFHALRGYSPRCAFSTPAVDAPHGASVVGVYRGESITPLHPDVEAAIEDATASLRAAGYVVEDIDTDLFVRLRRLSHLLIFEQLMRQYPEQVDEGGEILRRGIIGARLLSARLFGEHPALTLEDYLNGLAERGLLIVRLQELLERYPIILTPVSSEPPFEQDEDQKVDDDRRLQMADVIWPMESVPLAGVPALAVPTGHVFRGVPLGVQIIARRFAENDLFRAGRVIEARSLGKGRKVL